MFKKILFLVISGISSILAIMYLTSCNDHYTEGLEYRLSETGLTYSVTSIGTVHKKNIIIPEKYNNLKVVGIDDCAFKNCNQIAYITIPESVISIGSEAFSGCKSLKRITIPKGVTEIKDSLFEGCMNLTSVKIPSTVTSIGDCAFLRCSSLKTITIPEGVTIIGAKVFSGCISLKKLIIPEGVTNIGHSVFEDCYSMENISIPDSIQSIGSDMFGITTFGNYLFEYKKLKYNVYDGGIYLGNKKNPYLVLVAFKGSGSLNGTIHEQTKVVGSGISFGSAVKKIIIPDSVQSIGADTFDKGNLQYNEYNNGLYLGNDSNPYIYLVKMKDDKSSYLNIHEDTKIIGAHAFSGCKALKEIIIPENILSIGDYAFYSCWAKKVKISSSVKNLGRNVFSNCHDLESVIIKNGLEVITERSFFGCSSLKEIRLPKSIKYVGNSAFNDCYRLETIYYFGTSKQWGSINVCSSNDYLLSTIIIYK